MPQTRSASHHERAAAARHAALVIATSALILPVPSASAAPDRLQLPYKCTRVRGEIVVTPGPLRTVDILKPHDTRELAVCGATGRMLAGGTCAPVKVHRFDIRCGGKRVAWSDVALAIARRTMSTVPPVQSRAPEARWPQPGRVSCALRASSGGRSELTLQCRWPRAPWMFARTLIPAGFAPVAEVNARFIGGPAAPQSTPEARQTAKREPVAMTPLDDVHGSQEPQRPPASVAAIGPALASDRADNMGELVRADNAALPVDALSASAPERSRAGFGPAAGVVLGTVIAALLVGAAAARRWPNQARRVRAAAAGWCLRLIERVERSVAHLRTRVRGLPMRAPFTKPQQVADPKSANAAVAVSAMLADAERRLADLNGAGPLRDVLRQEVAGLQQRLAQVQVASAEGEEAGARAAPAYRNLMRDIERVRRIADSAALSLGGNRSPARVPTTKSEAYDLLGLNPDAPEGTMKKVADGLRMSWHPDHARNDADRAEREARIKAINIAIDLINGKRAAA